MVLTAPLPLTRRGVAPSGFRPDIEGMRAVAVLLVVVFHAGWAPLTGGFIGVDVFFVISGFLITRMLLAEARRDGRIRLARFWARRARRLLPASALVLVSVVAASFVLLGTLDRIETGRDVTAAAGFVANWWFAHQALDYFAADRSLSPVLHFWSLSLEEQYYLLWPPLLAGVLALRRRAGGLVRLRVAGALLLGIAVVSFGWSLLETRWTPVEAYYGTVARAWELAAGGLVAVLATARLALPRPVAVALSWAGLITVVVAAFTITEQTPFPGTAALAPVLGTVAVLVAGITPGLPGACRPLSTAAPRALGRLSYSWYLWHWPFLVLAPLVLGELDAARTALVVLASLAAAWLTFRLVEDPVRRSPALAASTPRSLLVGAVLIGVGVAAGLAAARPPVAPTPAQPEALATRDTTVGETRAPDDAQRAAPARPAIVPDPLLAREDTNQIRTDGCQSLFDWTEVKDCVYANSGSPRRWVLWGDSHAVQWFPALEAVARDEGVALQVYGKTSCPAPPVTFYSRKWDRVYHECTTWRDEVYRRVQQLPASTVVFLSGMHEYAVAQDGRVLSESESEAPIAAGLREVARTLTGLGMTVVAIRDTPFPERDVPACVAEHRDDPGACDVPRPTEDRGTSWEKRTLAGIPGVRHVDLVDEVCGPRTCPAVVDGILRWRDQDHLTATFVATLDEPLAAQLRDLGVTGGR